jgi:hypothetical protein
MPSIVSLGGVLWALIILFTLGLLVLLVVRRHYRIFPSFFSYVGLVLLQGAALFLAYRRWPFSSSAAWRASLATESVVLCARAFAVAEVCRHLLARFRGIWMLASRILVASGILVLVYTLIAAKHQWWVWATTAQLALELAIATVLVVLLLFARYYHVVAESPLRELAVGLCLYSCFVALNTALLQHWLERYTEIWNILDSTAFLASLLIWMWAFRKPACRLTPTCQSLDGSIYPKISPELNRRLRRLNEVLKKFRKLEVTPR